MNQWTVIKLLLFFFFFFFVWNLTLIQYSIFSYFEYFLHKIYLNDIISDLLKIFLISTILYFFQLIFISYMHMCLFSSLIHVTSDDGRQTLQWHRFSTIRLLVSAIYRNFGRVKYMIHKYYSPIVKPTKISTIVPFNTSNLRTLSSLLSSLLTFFPLKPPDP